mmetsp:Transcript_144968/g.255530  ORF Transcript_144968/g.255530 Transcript_144968/m.255530 type:complete len:523 (+) Transcript_144968:74-1642(+)
MIDLAVIWVWENMVLRIPGVAPLVAYLTGDVYGHLEQRSFYDDFDFVDPVIGMFLVAFVLPALGMYFISPKISGLHVFTSLGIVWKDASARSSKWRNESKATYSGTHRPPKLSKEDEKARMRGVQVLSKEEYCSTKQSFPPQKKVYTLYPPAHFPKGELLENPPVQKSWFRQSEPVDLTIEEGEAYELRLRALREGAEVLRQVRQYAQYTIRPGMEVTDIINIAEYTTNQILGLDRPRKRGLLSPVGLAVNEIVANWTSSSFDNRRWLLPTDLATLDLAVNVDGHFLDTAFSFSFDPMHDELLQVVRDATNTGVRLCGLDASVDDVGAQVAEVLNSGQVHTPDGKVLQVNSIMNLTGPLFGKCDLMYDKRNTIPLSRGQVSNRRMKLGELWVVDAFGCAGGHGYAKTLGTARYYQVAKKLGEIPEHEAAGDSVKEMAKLTERAFGTEWIYCERWLEEECEKLKMKKSQKEKWETIMGDTHKYCLSNRKDVFAEAPGSHTARFSHTVLIGSKQKEVLTRGTDF